MRAESTVNRRVTDWAFLALAGLYLLGVGVLMTALYRVQVLGAARFRYDQSRQSIRRVQVPGTRGRILDRNGIVLADCRPSLCVVCYAEEFQRRGDWSNTVNAIDAAIDQVAAVVKVPRGVSREAVARHVRRSLAMPLIVWKDLDDAAFARFAERAGDFPGFSEYVQDERVYPKGRLAAHVLGYVGRDRPDLDNGDEQVHFYLPEMRGRGGVEGFYDRYLVGVPGKRLIRVDARGYSQAVWEGEPEKPGPDLKLTLDANIQAALERSLAGVTGAGVVLDPRTGAVLAMASAPGFDPNAFVPSVPAALFQSLNEDPGRPLLNRATMGAYAPGSTFKPVTALAALAGGWPADKTYDCTGLFTLGNLKLHCWDRYGHGELALREAIEKSCNAFFCHLGEVAGSNAVISAARAFGLGTRTGIDLPGDFAGVVPDDAWKRETYREHWYPGDVCQMAIGQGMLMVTPLQMAVVCAALANGGRIYRPFLKAPAADAAAPDPVRALPFTPEQFALVRGGMRDVAEKGTGRRIRARFADEAWHPLAVTCAGKTGTAEIGRGAARRKNTWVIAFAPFENPTVAVAMIVERGESGGLTVAPRVHEVLASVFGETTIEKDSASTGAGEGLD